MDEVYAHIENIPTEISAVCAEIPVFSIRSSVFFEKFEIRTLWVEPYNYIGKALKGSNEDDPVWRIARIEVDGDGSVEVKKASSAKWTEVLIETYE